MSLRMMRSLIHSLKKGVFVWEFCWAGGLARERSKVFLNREALAPGGLPGKPCSLHFGRKLMMHFILGVRFWGAVV